MEGRLLGFGRESRSYTTEFWWRVRLATLALVGGAESRRIVAFDASDSSTLGERETLLVLPT